MHKKGAAAGCYYTDEAAAWYYDATSDQHAIIAGIYKRAHTHTQGAARRVEAS
jgi:hypothetical protein